MPLPPLLIRSDRQIARELFAVQGDPSLRQWLEEQFSESDEVLRVPDWQQIHQALTDGSLNPEAGTIPLNHCILGGRQLHRGPEMFASLKRPDLVPHIADALDEMTQEGFATRVEQQLGEEADAAAIWSSLQEVRTFYRDCATQGVAALFAVGLAQTKDSSPAAGE